MHKKGRATGPWLAFAAVFALSMQVAAAQTPGVGEETRKKVDAVFAAWDRADSPGCALGVVRGGELIYARGYGSANLEYGIPITPKTIFDIGSTSKQFTATAIHLLAQQGKLSLDDDIRKFLPEIPDYGQRITIGHLLHHTSGLRDYLTLMALAGTDFDGVTGDEDALQMVARQKALNFRPGDEHLYSNTGYFLLSVIVRRASGRSLREFAAEQIFKPLGMQATHYHDDHTMIVPLRATGYAPGPEKNWRIDMSGFEQTGDGAVYTSVEDLLRWDRNFYDARVGGRALIEQLQTTGTLNDGTKLTYATGLVVTTYRGLKKVSHGGAWAGYRADLIRFPDEKFSVVCLCNFANANPSRLAQQVADVFLADRLAPAVPAAPATPGGAASQGIVLSEAELKAKAGLYRGTLSGTLARVSFREAKLWLNLPGAPPSELIPIAANRFRMAGAPASYEMLFEARTPGGPVQMRFFRENARPEVYEPVESFSPTPEQLKEFTGTFYSEELDATYRIGIQEGKLQVRIGASTRRTLEPASRDIFTAPGGGQFEFRRDPSGKIAGFGISAGRIRNVLFTRKL
jgi:CubicO group peptidase (beta-lactamase class C family)